MGVAAWRVWRRGTSRDRHPALRLFYLQLGANFAWFLLFFGLHSPVAALVDIVGLLMLMGPTTGAFGLLDRRAVSMVPYAAWVTFATYLNAAFVVLN